MNVHRGDVDTKKHGLARLLDRICQALELTDTQHEMARERYGIVGTWLAESKARLLQGASIYPQGSVALGTTVRPMGRNEYDVDLVCFVPAGSSLLVPGVLKQAIGERLRENAHYARILEEKARCWRLNYANEFHMDITPSIANPACPSGGELVPDKNLKEWKPTNPRGYRQLFDRRAAIAPRAITMDGMLAKADRADIEPYPDQESDKGILRRTVQAAKRHRDMYFLGRHADRAPISVIITTLLAKSYEHCATRYVYQTEYDLFLEVIRLMPEFIERQVVGTQTWWFIWNETTAGENFAEKWNSDNSLAIAFFDWHRTFVSELQSVESISGLDLLSARLTKSFGQAPVSAAVRMAADDISVARKTNRLVVAAGVGLTTTGTGTAVRANTFFGA